MFLASVGLFGVLAGGKGIAQTRGEGILWQLQRLLEGREEPKQMTNSEFQDQRSRAENEDAREVEQLYSTKPIRFRMAGREYSVPVNYFTPKGRNEVEWGESKGFGFFLFLPDFSGYTMENWRDQFDKRLIKVLQLSPVNKNAMIPVLGGGLERITPAGYGEPKARFESHRRSLEEKPSFKEYGLEGYRWRNRQLDGVTWVGTRSNGEFFFFESSTAPGDPPRLGISNPICQVQYYSEQEALFINYRYSQEHIAKWKQIDDAIWARIHSWQLN